MQWIKSHLNVVVAGSVSVLALVAIVLGFILPDPSAAMSRDRPDFVAADGQRRHAGRHRRAPPAAAAEPQWADQRAGEADPPGGRPQDAAVGRVSVPQRESQQSDPALRLCSGVSQEAAGVSRDVEGGDLPSQLEIAEVTERMKRAEEQNIFEEHKGGDKAPRPDRWGRGAGRRWNLRGRWRLGSRPDPAAARRVAGIAGPERPGGPGQREQGPPDLVLRVGVEPGSAAEHHGIQCQPSAARRNVVRPGGPVGPGGHSGGVRQINKEVAQSLPVEIAGSATFRLRTSAGLQDRRVRAAGQRHARLTRRRR